MFKHYSSDKQWWGVGSKQLVGQNSPYVFCTHGYLINCMQRKWYFCSLVTESNQACIKYSPKCIWQFLLDCNIWRVPWDFYKQPPSTPTPNPQHPNGRFPTFHERSSSFCCLPTFSLLQPFKYPPKIAQDFNWSWKVFWHVIFLLQTKFSFWRFSFCLIFPHTGAPLNVHAVSIDPDVLP